MWTGGWGLDFEAKVRRGGAARFLTGALSWANSGTFFLGTTFLPLAARSSAWTSPGVSSRTRPGNVETKSSVANSADFSDVVANLFEHLAELAIAAFGEGELVPGVVAATGELDLRGAVMMRSRRPERTSSRRPRSIMMPRRIWSNPEARRVSGDFDEVVFSTPAAALDKELASSPSFVINRRPSDR